METGNPLLAAGCPPAVAGLDLSKPGLFEASAGTGKTYAIEHLVLRLLIECEDINLQKILVLTYTEKATGELKEKIRGRLAWRLAQEDLPPAIAMRLKDALLGFDRASIYTIHGFCERVLRKYAFENNSLFRTELVKKDREIFQEVLTEEMRSTWLSEAGTGAEGLAAFKEMARSLGFANGSKWDGKILDLAQEFNPLRGDALLPAFDGENLARAESALADSILEIDRLFPGLSAGRESEHAFAVKYRGIPFANATLKKKGPKLVEAALRLAECKDRDRTTRLEQALRYLSGIDLRAVEAQGFAYLAPGPGECPDLPWPQLDGLIGILESMRKAAGEREREIQSRSFRNQRGVIVSLREKAQAYKRDHGMISFNDMIEDVWKALDGKPERIAILRQDYRYCLVDEFQDTDPMQWDIFRTVFLASGSANPLFLIGDPKQAIYRFRGGDIHTYMAARKSLFALSRQGQAQGLGLDTNFRSSREMVAACNAVFPNRDWFHTLAIDPGDTLWRLPAEPDPLGYVPVGHGGLPIQEARDTTDHPAPVVLKDFSAHADPRKGAVRKRAHAWIAAEISRLAAAPERLLVPDKVTGALRPLRLSDICVLVGNRFEKAKLEKTFVSSGIPVQIERQAGLYQGDVAGQYLAVLESLEDVRDSGKHARALLTRFFRPSGDAPRPDLPENTHPLFEIWTRLADRRRWQRLFHSLLYDTGILYRESLGPDGDRRIMDFLHVGQNLVQEALRQNLSLSGLVQRLRELRSAPVTGEDEQDFHREDSEGGKVTLMTMHVSKGLEFPVVFLAGSSGGRPPEYFKYREGLRTIYNLDTHDADAKAAHKREAENEERRLFYVALTRARYKLYIPVFPLVAGRGSFGPLGGFVAQALRAGAVSRPELFHWSQVEGDPVPARAETPSPRLRRDAEAPQAHASAAIAVLPPLSNELDKRNEPGDSDPGLFSDYPRQDALSHPSADFSRRRRRLNSYSHLVRQGHGLAAETVEGRFDKEEAPASAEILGDPGDSGDETPEMSAYPANALPRGKDIGNMFHEILERLDFAVAAAAPAPEGLFAHAPTRDLIHGCMEGHRLDAVWRTGVAEVVWNTLRARLPDPAGGDAFSLAEVTQRRPEMEFLFPYPGAPEVPGSRPAGFAGTASEGPGPDGYLWGFIDLVFRHRGRYYLLDWKSNRLDAYGRLDLERSMRDSSYDLQYMLYSLALDKWLRSLIPDYAYETHFGGIYYAYLRGMRAPAEIIADVPAVAEASGVFALRPTPAQMRGEYPLHLAKVMGVSGSGGLIDASIFPGREAGPA